MDKEKIRPGRDDVAVETWTKRRCGLGEIDVAVQTWTRKTKASSVTEKSGLIDQGVSPLSYTTSSVIHV